VFLSSFSQPTAPLLLPATLLPSWMLVYKRLKTGPRQMKGREAPEGQVDAPVTLHRCCHCFKYVLASPNLCVVADQQRLLRPTFPWLCVVACFAQPFHGFVLSLASPNLSMALWCRLLRPTFPWLCGVACFAQPFHGFVLSLISSMLQAIIAKIDVARICTAGEFYQPRVSAHASLWTCRS
jgi:hypothetical protein